MRLRSLIFSVGLVFVALWLPRGVEAATLYWVGSDGANISVASNWKTTDPSGCGGGDAGAAPGVGDFVIFDADCDNGATIDSSWTVASLTMQSGYTGTVTQGADLQVNGTFRITGGTFTAGTYNITTWDLIAGLVIEGGTFNANGVTLSIINFTVSSGAFNEGTSTVISNSTATINVASSETFYKLTIQDGTTSLSSDTLTVSNTLTISSGRANTGTLVAQGNVTFSNLTAGGSATLTFSGSATQTFDATGTTGGFDADITVNKSGGQVNLASALVLDASSQDFTLTEGTFDLNGQNLTVNGTSGTLIVEDGGTLQLQGGESITANTNYPELQSGSTVSYDGTSGPYTIKNYTYHHLTIGGSGATFSLPANTDVNGNLTISAGTLDATSSNYNITLAGNWNNSGGAFTERSAIVTFDGSGAQTLTGETFSGLTIDNSAASPGDSTDVDSSAAVTVSNTLTVTDGQFQPTTASDFASVTIGTNGILKPDSGAIITVSSSWNNSGTFTANTGTVTFDATTSQTVIGATTFYNLSKTEGANDSTDETLSFAAGVTFTITNTLTLDGRDSDDRINIISSVGATKFTFDVTGAAQNVDYLDVVDSQTSSNDITCTNCVNSGNTDSGEASPHWVFSSGIDISGTVYSDEGSTALTSKTVRIAVNGTDGTSTTSHATTGAYSFSAVSVSSGDVVTLYLEDESQDAVTVTVVGTSNLSSINLFQDRVITRHDNSGSLTNSNLSTAAVSSETDISNIYSVASGNLTVQSGKELFIPSSHTFVPGGTVAADDVDINGTLTLGSNAGSVSGTWDATGGTFTTSGTVTFTSTTTETITSNSNSFQNITFNGSGGTWALASTLDVNGNLTISAGTLDASPTHYAITLAGNWNNSGGAFTERNGTVTFDGSDTQTLTGETFYNLTINNSAGSPSDSTDVDSSAAVTVSTTLTVTDGQFQPTTASDFAAVSIGTNGILKPDSAATITVSGSWTNSGTFTANSGTVTLDGADQTLAGTTTFYNVSKTVSSAATLTWPASTTTTISNTWTAQGASGQLLSLRSSSSGTQWRIDPQSTRTISYLDVKDSNNVNTSEIDADDGTNTDSGNNTNWDLLSNTAPTATSPSSIAQRTDGSGEVTFKTTLADSDSNRTQLLVEYSTNQSDWKKATIKSVGASQGDVSISNSAEYQIASIDTDTGNVTLTIIWDAADNFESNEESAVYLRVTPYDGTVAGTAKTSESFGVDTRVPQVSNFTVITTKATSLKFGWDPDLTESNFSAYSICYGKTQGSCSSTWDSTDDSALTTRATEGTTITGLTPSTTYYFTLTAVDTLGNATTLTLNKITTSSQPTVTLQVGDVIARSVQLLWNKITSPTFLAYELCYSTDSTQVTGSRCRGAVVRVTDAATTAATISNLLPRTLYAFLLRVLDTQQDTIQSNIVTATTCDNGEVLVGGRCVLTGGTTTSPSPTPDVSPTPTVSATPSVDPTPTLSPNPSPSPTPLTPPVLATALNNFKDMVAPLVNQPLVKVTTAVVATLAAVSAAASSPAVALTVVNFWQQLAGLFPRLWEGLFGLLGVRRRRRPWGRVIDAQTGQPLPKAVIQIFNQRTSRLQDTLISDAQGAFASHLPAGAYSVRVSKAGWALTPQAPLLRLLEGERVYDGGALVIGEEAIVPLVLALRPTEPQPTRTLTWRLIAQVAVAIINRLSWPMVVGGFILNSFAVWVAPTTLSWLIEGLYVVIVVFKIVINLHEQKALGTVRDVATRRPLDLALVRLYDAASGTMVATRVTGAKGNFFLLVPPGVYTVIVTREGYEMYRQSHMVVRAKEPQALVLAFALTPQPSRQMAVAMGA